MATGIMGWPPAQFWAATPHEFWAAWEGFERFHCRKS